MGKHPEKVRKGLVRVSEALTLAMQKKYIHLYIRPVLK